MLITHAICNNYSFQSRRFPMDRHHQICSSDRMRSSSRCGAGLKVSKLDLRTDGFRRPPYCRPQRWLLLRDAAQGPCSCTHQVFSITASWGEVVSSSIISKNIPYCFPQPSPIRTWRWGDTGDLLVVLEGDGYHAVTPELRNLPICSGGTPYNRRLRELQSTVNLIRRDGERSNSDLGGEGIL